MEILNIMQAVQPIFRKILLYPGRVIIAQITIIVVLLLAQQYLSQQIFLEQKTIIQLELVPVVMRGKLIIQPHGVSQVITANI